MFLAVIVKARRGLELFFCDIGAIAAKRSIVFEHCPGQPVMAFETPEKVPEINDCISNLSTDALDHEMIDAPYPPAMYAINGGALYFPARDQAFAASSRSSRCVLHHEILHEQRKLCQASGGSVRSAPPWHFTSNRFAAPGFPSASASFMRKVRRMSIFPWLIAALAGVLTPVQSGANGTLGKVFGNPYAPVLISLCISVVFAAVFAVAARGLDVLDPVRAAHAPWWAWIGGLCGAIFLFSQPAAAPSLGAAIYTGVVVTASAIASVAIDNFGVLGFAQHPASIGRLAGAALMITGVYLIANF